MLSSLGTAERRSAETIVHWKRAIQKPNIAALDGVLGARAQLVPLSLTPFPVRVHALEDPLVAFFAIASEGSYQMRRTIADGHAAFGYVEFADRFSVGARNGLSPDNLIVVSGADVLDVRVRGRSGAVWIDLDMRAFPELSALLPASSPAVLTSIDRLALMRLRACARAIAAMCASDGRLVGEDPVRRIAQMELAACLRQALAQSVLAPAASKKERAMYDLSQQIEAFMWENVEDDITLARIRRSVGCRIRTAIYCFKELFGLGPITYLKILRLVAVHRRLRERKNGLRIIDIAADFGFWHMGHFSADYKRLFQHTPSETRAARSLRPERRSNARFG